MIYEISYNEFTHLSHIKLFVIFNRIVVAACGASVAENCTYFESNGQEIGLK